MKRCIYCKKLIWSWQNKYLGLADAHAICESYEFSMGAIRNGFDVDTVLHMARRRDDAGAYTRSLIK